MATITSNKITPPPADFTNEEITEILGPHAHILATANQRTRNQAFAQFIKPGIKGYESRKLPQEPYILPYMTDTLRTWANGTFKKAANCIQGIKLLDELPEDNVVGCLVKTMLCARDILYIQEGMEKFGEPSKKKFDRGQISHAQINYYFNEPSLPAEIIAQFADFIYNWSIFYTGNSAIFRPNQKLTLESGDDEIVLPKLAAEPYSIHKRDYTDILHGFMTTMQTDLEGLLAGAMQDFNDMSRNMFNKEHDFMTGFAHAYAESNPEMPAQSLIDFIATNVDSTLTVELFGGTGNELLGLGKDDLNESFAEFVKDINISPKTKDFLGRSMGFYAFEIMNAFKAMRQGNQTNKEMTDSAQNYFLLQMDFEQSCKYYEATASIKHTNDFFHGIVQKTKAHCGMGK